MNSGQSVRDEYLKPCISVSDRLKNNHGVSPWGMDNSSLTFDANRAAKTGAVNSSRGMATGFRGATLHLLHTNGHERDPEFPTEHK